MYSQAVRAVATTEHGTVRQTLSGLSHTKRKIVLVPSAQIAEPIGHPTINNRLMRRVIEKNSEVWFKKLVYSWKKETAGLSSIDKKVSHPAYKEIIGMGESAIRPILAEMQKEPGHWFSALKAITGLSLVPPEMRGRVDLMTAVWLDWGKEKGFI
jgi:hypothetical protein